MHALSWDYIKEKWSHAGFQKYFRNTGWMFAAQMANIVSLAVNIWLARYLGPENYGSLSYVFAFAGMFAFIAGLGINDILIRDLVRYPEKKDTYLGTSAWLLAGGGIGAFLITTIATFILEPAGILKWLIIIYATTFLFSPQNVITAFFQARVEAKKNSVAQMVNAVGVSLIKIFLILTNQGIIWITCAFILDYIFGCVLYIYNYKKSGFKFSDWKFDTTIAKNILSNSYLLMLSTAISFLLLRIDQVMLKHYLDSASVGLYAAAIRLSEVWYFIPGIISVSLFPAIVNAKKTSHEMYFDRLKKLLLFLFLGGVAIALATSLLAPMLIKILFGSAYIASVPVVHIYIWSGVGLFLTMGLTKYLLTENRLFAIFSINLIAVILNISLNMLLIPKIGLTGAAWATLISYTISPLFALELLRRDKRRTI